MTYLVGDETQHEDQNGCRKQECAHVRKPAPAEKGIAIVAEPCGILLIGREPPCTGLRGSAGDDQDVDAPVGRGRPVAGRTSRSARMSPRVDLIALLYQRAFLLVRHGQRRGDR